MHFYFLFFRKRLKIAKTQTFGDARKKNSLYIYTKGLSVFHSFVILVLKFLFWFLKFY
jgi:hypothetical protein